MLVVKRQTHRLPRIFNQSGRVKLTVVEFSVARVNDFGVLNSDHQYLLHALPLLAWWVFGA